MHKVSKFFWPVVVTPKNVNIRSAEYISRSQKLMTELGLIKAGSHGTFQIMPMAQRVLDKCVDLVDRRMRAINGQKITLPILTSASLWEKSGRLRGDISEFFLLRDRHNKEFLLSPTHEEAVTAMLAAAAPISYRQLPLRLYQVGPKFRDELKTRFGLLRAKEFLMKDLYTFDRNNQDANHTYDQLVGAYKIFFRQLEVPYVTVEADSGMMGGSTSHEFHYIAASGEDRILHCKSCGFARNVEVSRVKHTSCPQCQNHETFSEVRGIEVGHSFLLGDKYSRPLGATYLTENGKPETLVMGCYGIGISRVVAAALEVLSTDTHLRWPALLAPFDVCVIGPKQGSKEQLIADSIQGDVCGGLVELFGEDSILLDDRKTLTIGKRLIDAQRMGYPLIVVIGSEAMQEVPKIELHIGDEKLVLEPNDLLSKVRLYRDRKRTLLEQ